MSKLSRSPDRHTFLKKTGKYADQSAIRPLIPVNEHEVSDWLPDRDQQESNPAWQEHNLEHDLRSAPALLDKVRTNDTYAQNLYAALCNTQWRRDEVLHKLRDDTWHCSWRHAGGIIADMRGEGDYIEWYMSGMDPMGDGPQPGSVPEGTVTAEVREDLRGLGWYEVSDGKP